MDENMRRMLGDGPYPFPVEDIGTGEIVDSYIGPGMIILTSKGSMFMPRGSHAHESYEFLIPLSDMQNTAIDRKIISIEKNRLLPLNSEQFHGLSKEIHGCRLFAFQIDKDVLNQISYSICNKSEISFQNESYIIGNEIQNLLRMFMIEARNIQAGRDFILQNLVNLIVINLLRQLKSNIPAIFTEHSYCERDNINRAISYLREQFTKEYSLDEVAGIANLSPYHFIRTFKSMTGKTPYDYLLDVKMEKAKELLKQKGYTITEICFICGFNNLEHFASVFKRKVGTLPSQYRKLSTEL